MVRGFGITGKVFILLFCNKVSKYFISMRVKKFQRQELFYLDLLLKNDVSSNKYNTFMSGHFFFFLAYYEPCRSIAASTSVPLHHSIPLCSSLFVLLLLLSHNH